MPTRKAQAVWQGGLRQGKGTLRGESGAINTGYSFGSRFEEASGASPEELLAAAEAACYAMALGSELEKNGTPAAEVETDAACTIDKVGTGFKITGIKLMVQAAVPGVDEATFQRIAAATKDSCPVSQALRGGVPITLDAKLR